MRIVLEVKSSQRYGHKMLLGQEQTIQIGRSPLCDFAFEDDTRMSGTHFELQTNSQACYLKDLGSTNGTFVNHQKVNRSIVLDGDTIQAGSTEFIVSVEGIDQSILVTKTVEMSEVALHRHATFGVEMCRSGVTCYEGSSAASPVSRLADHLATVHDYVLIVDAAKIGLGASLLPEQPDYLFDWMPEGTRANASPLMLTSRTPFDAGSLLDRAWGKDAVVVIYTEKDEDLPLEQIRRASGTFLRPTIARPQLALGDPDLVKGMLSEIAAVLLDGEKADTWNLLTYADLTDTLERIGYQKAAS